MAKEKTSLVYDLKDINNQLDIDSRKLVLDAESNYRGQLFKLAKKILSGNKNKIVLLAGPSCAGKTTTANLLKEILERFNKHVITISMDDFFLNREDTPKLPDGSYDFDSIRAINLDQMQAAFTELFEKGNATFPRFDFKQGLNHKDGHELELRKNTIVLFEGIHVLNPELTKKLGTNKFFKVYAHPETHFTNGEIELDSTNLRLVRRMIRDVERRGHTPELTLKMWKNVRDAEIEFIEPFKKDVDYMVNTTHSYELAVYKKELYTLLFNHENLIRELPFIGIFDTSRTLGVNMIPDTSLMWEFIDRG